MERIDGKHIVAVWLLTSSLVALLRLATLTPDIVAHLSAWRAALGPFVAALLGIVAAWRLFRRGDGVRLAGVVLLLPVIALSVGPLAYQLDVGPFVRLGITGTRTFAAVGSDARLLLILGSGNHVPSGIAINVATLAAFGILLASRRPASDEGERSPT